MSKYKTTPKEKMIINLMEEVINILSTCEDLSDPAFSMYDTMKHAVDKEVYYPLYDKWKLHLKTQRKKFMMLCYGMIT